MGKTLFVSMGDPAGIGGEITLKALVDQELASQTCNGDLTITLATTPELLQRECRKFGFELEAVDIRSQLYGLRRNGKHSGGGVPVEARVILMPPGEAELQRLAQLGIHPSPEVAREAWDMLAGSGAWEYGAVSASCALVACLSLYTAYRQARCSGGVLVTAPVNKEAFKALGVPFPGHTEFLGALSQGKKGLTMFQTRGLRIFFHSRHVSLRQACDLLAPERLVPSIKECLAALKDLGVVEPHLAVAGLNPHNGEHGLFGDEEERWIRPAVEQARSLGLKVSGPIPADSVFHWTRTGRYDAVLSLYHDQGHIAAKTLDFERTVSFTLGLDVLRTSVDHGTAFDIAGRNLASPIGMEAALKAAVAYSR